MLKVFLLIATGLTAVFTLVQLFMFIVGYFHLKEEKFLGPYSYGFVFGLQLTAIGLYLYMIT
jgi:hypothetical protein